MLNKIKFIFSILLFESAISLSAQNSDIETIATSATSVAATALAHANVALARSVLTPTAFRGSLGESVAGESFLKDTLSRTGNWQSIAPRSGPQGFDHLFVKTNSRGAPTDLIIGESKFNTSHLGMTKDGIQMGTRWTSTRLAALGSRYLSVANDNTISLKKIPLNPNRQISVVLKNGQQKFFWKNSSLDTWKFSGTQKELAEARKLAANYGVFLKNAGDGAITFRSRIFNIVPKGNDLEIIIYDAKNLDGIKGLQDLRKLSAIRVEDALSSRGTLPVGAQNDIAKVLKTKLGLNDADARTLANRVQSRYNPRNLMTSSSLFQEILANSAKASFIVMGIDSIIQLTAAGEVDIGRVVISGGSAFIGVGSGQLIHIGLTSPYMRNAIRGIAGPLYCSTDVMTSTLSSLGGGVITTALFSYGLYFMGYSDLKTANRQMAIGTVAIGAGTLFVAGTMSAIAIWGTAGTGTAIATLNGAAATSASLAFLGGGTVAAGGGGVALGSAILSGGTILIVVAVAYGGYKLYLLKDEADESNRIRSIIASYSQDEYLDIIIHNSPYVRALK